MTGIATTGLPPFDEDEDDEKGAPLVFNEEVSSSPALSSSIVLPSIMATL